MCRCFCSSCKYAFILCYIAIQLYLPISYYMEGSDPFDERFAWRMLSETHVSRCSLTLFNLTRDNKLYLFDKESDPYLSKIGIWYGLAEKGDKYIGVKIASFLCDSYPKSVTRIRIVHNCFLKFTEKQVALTDGTVYCL